MLNFYVKRNWITHLFFLACLAIAIDESKQNTLTKRLTKRSSYGDSPYCRECERECRERDRERRNLGMDYVCGRRVFDGVLRTFESTCLMKCHNDCYVEDKYEYRFEYRGECGHRDHEHHEHHDDRYDEHDRRSRVLHDSLNHADIPGCEESRKCLCPEKCEPTCARSLDTGSTLAIFHNNCRLVCTNQCFAKHEGFVPADGPICRQAIRDHYCDFNRRG